MTFKVPSVGSVLRIGSIAEWDAKPHRDMEHLTGAFQSQLGKRVSELGLTARIVRGMLPRKVAYILHNDSLCIVCEVADGVPYPGEFNVDSNALSEDQIERVVTYEFGYTDPFYAKLPRQLLSLQHDKENETSLNESVLHSVDGIIAREGQRARAQERRIRIRVPFKTSSER